MTAIADDRDMEGASVSDGQPLILGAGQSTRERLYASKSER